MLPSCNFFLVVDDLKNIDHLERCIEQSDVIVIFVRRCVMPMTHTRARADPSAARRRRRPAPLRVQFDAYTRCAWSCCRALARHRAAVWTLWLASSRVAISLRATALTSRATC